MSLVMKFNPNTHMVVVFCTAFVGACVLIGMGRMDPEYLKYFLVWLAPAPFQFGDNDSSDAGK